MKDNYKVKLGRTGFDTPASVASMGHFIPSPSRRPGRPGPSSCLALARPARTGPGGCVGPSGIIPGRARRDSGSG